eukprot:COSAG01_NODE_77024_length_173_cov_9.364865_1_plen_20_part_01
MSRHANRVGYPVYPVGFAAL